MAYRLPPPPSNGQNTNQNHPVFDNYLTLRNSYFNMINNKNDDHTAFAAVDPGAPALIPLTGHTAAAAAAASSFQASPYMHDKTDVDSFRELLELCGMTPEGTPALANFDGSPMEETPLFTPALDMFSTPYLDGWDTSPMPGGGDMNSFDDLPPLFAPSKPVSNTNTIHNNNATIDDQALLTLPETPSLAPASLLPSTLAPPMAVSNNARKGPTGFRKGTNPTNMVPMDAPTQTRQYLSESKTSRKELPAAFQNKARKRQHEELLDEDEVPDDIQDAITAKRRLNTLAARRSRARKAQTALENEQRINDLQDQIDNLQEALVRVTAERDAYRVQLGLP